MPSIDTRQYEFADMSINLGGRDLTEFRWIKVTEKIEREPLHAKGRNPHSIQSGNITYEVELGLLQSEYETLVKAGNGSILSLRNLTAVVNFGDPTLGDVPITNRIEGLYFTEASSGLKQGEKFQEHTLPGLALRVKNQVA